MEQSAISNIENHILSVDEELMITFDSSIPQIDDTFTLQAESQGLQEQVNFPKDRGDESKGIMDGHTKRSGCNINSNRSTSQGKSLQFCFQTSHCEEIKVIKNLRAILIITALVIIFSTMDSISSNILDNERQDSIKLRALSIFNAGVATTNNDSITTAVTSSSVAISREATIQPSPIPSHSILTPRPSPSREIAFQPSAPFVKTKEATPPPTFSPV